MQPPCPADASPSPMNATAGFSSTGGSACLLYTPLTLKNPHTPALDCAGLIAPGATVFMTAHAPRAAGSSQQPTKTSHTIQVAQDPMEGGAVALVGAHPQLAERIAAIALERRWLPLPPELQGYSSMLRQQTVGSSRFDFGLTYAGMDGSRLLVEVKNVVCAEKDSASQPGSRAALFPHGAKKAGSGVVSDRAIKHLHELVQLQQAGADGEGRPVRSAVLFIVNRSDCQAFRPKHEADMMFACMLHRAQQAGVLVLAHDVNWQGSTGRVMWGKPLPVLFGAGVSGDSIDPEQLSRVLAFNASNLRTQWKKKKQKPTPSSEQEEEDS